MDTGVEHGRHPDPSADEPGGWSAGSPELVHRPAPAPVYDDVPTTILDLRRAFAEAGPSDAPPLGVVTVEREHPFRAALAFVAAIVFIAGTAGGLVIGAAALGKSLYEKSSAPPTCSASQVAGGATLAKWLGGVRAAVPAVKADVVRGGCVTEGLADPRTGQSAALTLPPGKTATAVADTLRLKHDCLWGQPSPSGVRVCTVTIDTRLAAVELRPAKDKKSVTFTVTFR